MAKRKKKIEIENIELEPVETLEFQTKSEPELETVEDTVENNVETEVKEIKTSKYKVGNIINIKGIPYIVYSIDNGMYKLMSFNNKNVIEISETDL